MEVARSEAEAFLTAFAADPARARAVVAFLLTEEELARALHEVEHDYRPRLLTCMMKHRRRAAAILDGLDPADAGVRARNYARSIAAEDASGGYREIAGCGCEHCASLRSPDPADA
jgi:hypothetical protein